jgi:uncharacterized cupin superfamily protein
MEGAYGGAFKRARAELGVESFGMQVIDMPPNTDAHPEHDHSGDGQEEVYLSLRGTAEIAIDGERHQLDPDTMVRVSAGTKRKIYTGDESLRVLVISGCPGEVYKAPELSKLGTPDVALQSN